jgi:hypothetical protein
MKKGWLYFASLFSLVLFSSLVSAQSDVFRTILEVVISTINAAIVVFGPFLVVVIGDYGNGEFFFAKILLLFLLFIVINAVLRQARIFESSPSTIKIIAAIVSILAIRFISDSQLVRGILLPYGALGVAITTIMPFLVFFYFVYFSGMAGFGRRISWVIFGIVFTVFWASRTYGGLPAEFNWIFGLTTVAIILALIFDRGIKSYFHSHEMDSFKRGAAQKSIVKLQAEYLNILHVDTTDADRRRRAIERQLRSLGSNIP